MAGGGSLLSLALKKKTRTVGIFTSVPRLFWFQGLYSLLVWLTPSGLCANKGGCWQEEGGVVGASQSEGVKFHGGRGHGFPCVSGCK